MEIALYSLTGQKILYKRLENTCPKELISLQTNHIPRGVYICSMRQGNNTIQQKILKK